MNQHRVFGITVVAVFAALTIGVTACVPNSGTGTTTTTTSATTTTAGPSTSHTVKAVRVATGRAHTCAILSDTTARCWGRNDNGQLGNGSFVDSSVPIKVSALSNLIGISAGLDTTCAVRYDGTAWCWGYNGEYEAGLMATTNVVVQAPHQVNISGVTQVATGDFHSCGLKGGTVWCWGYNGEGQLGAPLDTTFPDETSGNPKFATTIPQMVPGITTAIQISSGAFSSCAVLADGSVKCWGRNTLGQITLSSPSAAAPPTIVPGLSDVVEVTVGLDHSCGRSIDGGTKCWGYGDGQIGNGLGTGITPGPVPVATGATAAVEAGWNTTCATLIDKSAACWGYDSGANLVGTEFLEDGFPHPRTGLAGVTDLSVGPSHACAVISDGAIKCWGRNIDGELGHGTTSVEEVTPINVIGIPFVVGTPIDCSARGVGVDLHGCNLTGVNLSGGNLSEANLSGADLTDAVLTNTVLTGANLAATTLTGAQGFGTGNIGGVIYTFNTVCPDGSTPKTNFLMHDYFGCYPS